MTSTRPASVIIIAVLHFIMGAFGLLCGSCFAIGTFAGGKDAGGPNPFGQGEFAQAMELTLEREEFVQQELDRTAPWHRAFEGGYALVWLGLSLCLIIAGVGLLSMSGWGRMLSILYGFVSILSTFAYLGYTVAYDLPARQLAAKEIPSPDPQEAKQEGVFIQAGAFSSVLFLIYPGIVLLVMFLPSTAQAFSNQTSDDDDYRREDYGTRRRRRRDDYDENSGWAEN